MLKNRLYRFNLWLDRNEVIKFLLLIILILSALLNLYIFEFIGYKFLGNLVSILVISIISIFAIFRVNIMNGNIKFDRSKYVLPEIGEILVIQKEFYWDGGFCKSIPRGPGVKPWHWDIRKDTEWEVINIEKTDGDWYIFLIDKYSLPKENRIMYNISIKLIDNKSYYKTKSQIRNSTLIKIGI